MKERVLRECPGVCAEHPGSRWPKLTLGAVRDGAPPLSPADLASLSRVCAEASRGLSAGAAFPVAEASVVSYACRSLERVVREVRCGFAPGPAAPAPVAPASAEFVARVLAEADGEGYWERVAGPGNREGHYRGEAAGATLAHWVGRRWAGGEGRAGAALARLGRAVAAFRDRVEEALPGRYAFFADEALHVTLRALR